MTPRSSRRWRSPPDAEGQLGTRARQCLAWRSCCYIRTLQAGTARQQPKQRIVNALTPPREQPALAADRYATKDLRTRSMLEGRGEMPDNQHFTLPVTVEQIESSTLTRLVSTRFPGVEALACAVSEAISGTATKVRLTVRWDAGKAAGLPERVVLKGGFGEHRERMAFLYRHETRFYEQLQSRLGVNSPRCLGSGHDEATDHHLVLMEDLDAAGARFFRVVEPIGEERVREFLDILAGMHAATWESTDFAAGGDLADLHQWAALPLTPMGDYARGQLEAEVWDRYMKLPRALAVSRRFHDRAKMRRALERIDDYTKVRPRCLLHGDFHLGNLYVDAAGRAAVLDWQSYAAGHWSHDVTYFMVSALDMADRRRCESRLLAYYLERLAHHGVAQPPSFDEALEAFRIQIADGLFYWMVNPPEWQVEENNCAVAPRFADAALDHGTFDDL
jgi:hypothetical protein